MGDDLRTHLTEFELAVVRHSSGRKCGDWSEADSEEPILMGIEFAEKLGIFDVSPASSPFDQLPEKFAGGIFVARIRGTNKMYVVNTEGYNYCRYVAPCKIVLF